MVPLRAELSTEAQPADQRRAPRRTLKLEVPSSVSLFATKAVIHNLSEAGLLIETSVELGVGEVIEVELPQAGSAAARVIRRSGTLYGCEFTAPVAKAAVSAALLRSPIEQPELLVPLWNPPDESARANRADLSWEVPYDSGKYTITAEISLIVMVLPVVFFLYTLASLSVGM